LLPPNWVQERLSKSLGNKDAVHARQHVCLAPGSVLDPDIPSDGTFVAQFESGREIDNRHLIFRRAKRVSHLELIWTALL
jgi:hypothetical protein